MAKLRKNQRKRNRILQAIRRANNAAIANGTMIAKGNNALISSAYQAGNHTHVRANVNQKVIKQQYAGIAIGTVVGGRGSKMASKRAKIAQNAIDVTFDAKARQARNSQVDRTNNGRYSMPDAMDMNETLDANEVLILSLKAVKG